MNSVEYGSRELKMLEPVLFRDDDHFTPNLAYIRDDDNATKLCLPGRVLLQS